MTVIRRDGAHQSPFYQWLRETRELDSREYQLSVTDGDAIVHRFSNRNERNGVRPLIEHMQIVEVKTFYADMPFAQKDTLQVLDLLVRKATVKRDRRYPIRIPDQRSGRVGSRSVRWFGVHLLQMSSDRPDRSDRMIWDGKYDIDIQTLIELLRFDRDPDHPHRSMDTRRHHLRPVSELHPKLALEGGS